MDKQNNRQNNKETSNLSKYSGILFFIFLLIIGYMGYTFYYHYSSNMMLQGYSYLSKDLANIEYLFETKGTTKEDCLTDCQTDYLCTGVTYDSTSNTCYGSRDGKMRSDEYHLYGWSKKKSNTSSDTDVLVHWTKTSQKILRRQIPTAPFPNRFSVTFWFQIDDWHYNYALWRNIIYQGTNEESEMQFTTWGDVITKIPQQRFGVWIAPFTNNLRFVVGTKIPYDIHTDGAHPRNQICKGKNCYIRTEHMTDDNYYDLEYKDVKNIDINIPVMVAIVFDNKSFNIYINGKLKHNIHLSGEPVPLNNDCFVKPDKSYDGHFIQLKVWDHSLSSEYVNQLYNDESKSIFELVNHRNKK